MYVLSDTTAGGHRYVVQVDGRAVIVSLSVPLRLVVK